MTAISHVAGGWSIAMRWHDLLFLHWPIPTESLRPHVPASLEIDEFDGTAWIGVVPFRMTGVRPRGIPSLPWLSAFAELNVRTYVRHRGRLGVWFFSLDAANPIAVFAARRTFHLPYFNARMSCRPNGDGIAYQSVRTHRGAVPCSFVGTYRPEGDVHHSRDGDLDAFLTERYSLYSADRDGRVYRGDILHERWPLQSASARIETNTMSEPIGIRLPALRPHLLFARRLDVVAWRLHPAEK